MTEITKIQSELAPLQTEITSLREHAEAITIANDDDYAKATDTMNMVNTKLKAIEKMRKFFVDPLNKQVKDINAMFKPESTASEEIVRIIKKKMVDYYDAKEAKARAEEARKQKIRDEANKKREEAGKELIDTPIVEATKPQKFVDTGNSKAAVRKVWTHEIESINSLPEDVKQEILAEAFRKGLIKTVVQKYVDAGVREMPGVRIFEETRIAGGNVQRW